MRNVANSLFIVLLAARPAPAQQPGRVTLPLGAWQEMLRLIERQARDPEAPVAICAVERSLEGSFRKGLFSGELTESFEVLDQGGHLQVPILDAGASIEKVLLDGRATSLIRSGGMYRLGIDRPGRYRVRVRFYWGQEQDRFSRRLRFRLPDQGGTRIKIQVPETNITVSLKRGVLTSQQARAPGTVIEGYLEPAGLLDLSWKRQLRHRADRPLRLQVHQHTLLTAGEVVVGGRAVFDIALLEGEADRIDLLLEPDIEVLRVSGEAVLQWRTEHNTQPARLTVLLRHLVQDRLRLAVQYQFPAREGRPFPLRLPLPPAGSNLSGSLGILGPAGLAVKVVRAERARQLTLRDVPAELAELAGSPLLFAFSHQAGPAIELQVTRQQEQEMTSTLVDELQASSVLIADGTEVTKLKLRLRNNTRQYLTMRLPAGAVLTHSLIDGQPVRPAYRAGSASGEELMFPLRQSERLDAGGKRWHTVQAGETLSGLANFYYADPNQWRLILANNADQLDAAEDLSPGQRLRIPTPSGVALEESTFVIELAYQRRHRALGWLGSRQLQLPVLDVDTMKVVWHLYFPAHLEPLRFSTGLTQLTALRYDPFRRLRDFLRRALFERSAWAGVRYESILKQRKAIYRVETKQRVGGEVVLAAFPLTGKRYRFRQVLPGREQPTLSVGYLDRDLSRLLRWLAFLLALGLALPLLLGRPRPWLWAVAAACGLLLLVQGHYILGTYRRLLWGIDLALLATLWRWRGRPALARWRRLLWSPWRAGEVLRLDNLLFLVGLCLVGWLVTLFPLLLSSLAGFYLAVLWWRSRGQAVAGEVGHD